jgi:hypothetical protein
MKMKLTRITGIYTLLGEDDKMHASDDVDMQKDYQIGKLSKQNCDEVFGVVDVERLAEDSVPDGFRTIWKDGFNKAMELNKDKVFTIDDIDKSIEWATVNGRKGDITHYDIDNFIQSLQQPTEIEVEIETETKVWEFISNGEFESFEIIPKLDENGCLILKRI